MEKCYSIVDIKARLGKIWGLRPLDMAEAVVMVILIGNSVLKRLFIFWNETRFTCKAMLGMLWRHWKSVFLLQPQPFLDALHLNLFLVELCGITLDSNSGLQFPLTYPIRYIRLTVRPAVANAVSWVFLAFHVFHFGYSGILLMDTVKPYSHLGAVFPSAGCTQIVLYKFVRRMFVLHLGMCQIRIPQGGSFTTTTEYKAPIREQILEFPLFFKDKLFASLFSKWGCGAVPRPFPEHQNP